jgi:hypothetical protein
MACFVEDMSGRFHSIGALLRLIPRKVSRQDLPQHHPLYLSGDVGEAAKSHIGTALQIEPGDTYLAIIGSGELGYLMDFVSGLDPRCPVFFQTDLYNTLAGNFKNGAFEEASPVLLWHLRYHRHPAILTNYDRVIMTWLAAIGYTPPGPAGAPRPVAEQVHRAVQL